MTNCDSVWETCEHRYEIKQNFPWNAHKHKNVYVLLHISNESSHSSSVDKAVLYERERANMNNSCVYSIIESIRFTLLFRINTKLRNNQFQTIDLSIQKAVPLNQKKNSLINSVDMVANVPKQERYSTMFDSMVKCIPSRANIRISIIYASPQILMIYRHWYKPNLKPHKINDVT